MSVKVMDRTLSKCEAVWQAQVIRDMVHDLCLRNFGIKDMVLIVRRKILLRCDPKANIDRYVLLLSQYKNTAYEYAEMLCRNTRRAEMIRMNSLENCKRRLAEQEDAKAACFYLLEKTQDIINTFFVDVNKYQQYVEEIQKEINLIDHWSAYTRKMIQRYST